MMIIMSVGVHHYHLLRHRPYLFLRFKCPVRDAEDAWT